MLSNFCLNIYFFLILKLITFVVGVELFLINAQLHDHDFKLRYSFILTTRSLLTAYMTEISTSLGYIYI